MILERILKFIRDPQCGDFESLALAAFSYQYERIPAYRRLCDGRGMTPDRVTRWSQVPPVPAAAFRSLKLAAEAEQQVFRSSGTSGGPRSVHYHPFPDLYRQVIDATFPGFCLLGLSQPPMLALVPPRQQLPDSSLSFMVEHILNRFGADGSVFGFGPRGVDIATVRTWLGARQRARQPGLILATAFALVQCLEALQRLDLRFRLPPGSVVFETGGFKGRTKQISRRELVDGLSGFLGIPERAVVREYGMTELTSQCYTAALRGGDPERFLAPHWMRVRILNPQSLQEAVEGEEGLIAVFDLANLGSAVHLLTEDLGAADGDGFRLLGRAAGARLRGCSLTVEDLEPPD